jgi:hypothetical protein
LQSISEAGTIANRASPILPYCLGALALFSLTYAIQHGYDGSDRIFTVGMFAGFTAVAMQMCLSPYVEQNRVGLLGLSPGASNIVHDAGAIVGFGSMILWILLCFRRSGVPPAERTPRKRLRNRLYIVLAAGMLASLSLFALDRAGLFGDGFPVLFAAECQILTFGGLACMTKGGLILADQ